MEKANLDYIFERESLEINLITARTRARLFNNPKTHFRAPSKF